MKISKFVFFTLVFLLVPALSFGQGGFDAPLDGPAPAPIGFGGPTLDAPPVADSAPPPAALPATFAPVSIPVAADPTTTMAAADQPPTLPMPLRTAAAATSRAPAAKQVPTRLEPPRSVIATDHPFYNYFDPPSDAKSPIQGKPYTVAQLLDGVRSPAARRQLLASYWELAGILAEWNMRFDAERRVTAWYSEASKAKNSQQRAEGFTGPFYIAQQQRKATEIAFAKKQYQLVENLRALKGTSLAPKDYPIPADYPIVKNYVTYVERIARTERVRHVGRMIPHQAELVEAKKKGRQVADAYFVAATQNPQGSPQDYVFALNQRTDAFIDLVASVVDYNKSIAEYATETVGSHIDNHRFLGAVLELQKPGAVSPTAPTQLASPPPPVISQLEYRLPEPPPTFAPMESAYSRPLEESFAAPDNDDSPSVNLFAEVKSQPASPIPSPGMQPVSFDEATPPDASPVQTADYIEEQ